ncbi:hypothetical protein FB005_1493 [Sinorhizobium medicae]|nr:hypothetical protein FB006_15112 [Sinorhizobium medicae]TWA33412.1 hypothetical protein FB005_1493 [Sinorhizobium medicae]
MAKKSRIPHHALENHRNFPRAPLDLVDHAAVDTQHACRHRLQSRYHPAIIPSKSTLRSRGPDKHDEPTSLTKVDTVEDFERTIGLTDSRETQLRPFHLLFYGSGG